MFAIYDAGIEALACARKSSTSTSMSTSTKVGNLLKRLRVFLPERDQGHHEFRFKTAGVILQS